eukprot:TRINITY_DN4343_c1_g1_i1.p1 TRINITY_DN4343_c1_g1~~TRINITY_DN4343_c1_g1_i1.p1  ORF type:complete len:383 (-),score=193.26 TRINITY_DN4343_c1_g1_i1:299-1447(-)
MSNDDSVWRQQMEIWKLKQQINFLNTFEIRLRELLTIYVPPLNSLKEISDHLENNQVRVSMTTGYTRFETQKAKKLLKKIQEEFLCLGKAPPNGIACFAALNADTDAIVLFEPHLPLQLNEPYFCCDNTFFVQPLKEMLDYDKDDKVGFMIVDTSCLILATARGLDITILQKSVAQFPRTFTQAQYNAALTQLFIRAGQIASNVFIDANTEIPIIGKIVLAGPADFQNGLKPTILNHKLTSIYHSTVQSKASTEAVQELVMSAQLSNLFRTPLAEAEERLLHSLSGRQIVRSVADILSALERKQIDFILVKQNYNFYRNVIRGKIEITDSQNDSAEQSAPVIEYLIDNYKKLQALQLFVVPGNTPSGKSFCEHVGIAGVMRR